MDNRAQMPSPSATPHPSDPAHGRLLVVVAGLTVFVLVWASSTQIFDTNFQTLFEATALLNGDHPYRDFFEWGVPLQALVSAVAQVLFGNRLIGEFLVQWLFIVSGVVISFHLSLRLAHSVWASLFTMLLALPLLAVTPTYTYPKLFFYPLAVWLLWRYVERPSARRSVALGFTTAVAFLFRHDHGVYIGVASALAFILLRFVAPSSRSMRSLVKESAAYLATSAAILAPWLIVVHLHEGLPEYIQLRADLFEDWSGKGFIYQSLFSVSPIEALGPTAEVAFAWLFQVVLLIPILLLMVAALDLLHSWWRAEPVAVDTYRLVVAAILLVVVETQTFKQQSYSLHVIPLTAAMSTRLLAARRGDRSTAPRIRRARFGLLWLLTRGAVTFGMLFVTTVATVTFTHDRGAFDVELLRAVRPTFQRLLASPPIDGYMSAHAALEVDKTAWEREGADRIGVILRYVRECTRPGDRILVTGSTPYHVGYYTGRSIAGGHLFWHFGWRSDPAGEARSLTMLQSQSVPFALSTTEPILEDFVRYPTIREHLVNNYIELDGSEGYFLVDKRRQPTGRFGALGFPCFG